MILASKSPRRKEILENFGIKIDIRPNDIEEVSEKIKIEEKIKDIAYKKAYETAKDFPEKYVLGADTVVVYNNQIMGKPKNKEEAYEMLNKLSGKWHEVITAYSFINIKSEFILNDYDITKVKFKNISKENIDWYISTNDPMDKAGAYGIQGKGTFIVEKIEGDFYNVMGFPISKFINTLLEKGFTIEEIIRI